MYGSTTKSNQIILMLHDPSTGDLRGVKYLGFVNPYELSSITQTADGGLAVIGTTYVAGRFPRVCLFKIGPVDLEAMSAL